MQKIFVMQAFYFIIYCEFKDLYIKKFLFLMLFIIKVYKTLYIKVGNDK